MPRRAASRSRRQRDFVTAPGKGVTGLVDGRRVAVGNTALLASLGIDPGDLPARADALRQEGQGVMLIAIDGTAAGLIAVADPIKESAIGALKALRAERIRVVMLTGDSRTTAAAVGRKLGIDDVVAEVLPDQKASAVKKFQAEGRFVAMAGDGINDAPALAQAAGRHRDGHRRRRRHGERGRHAHQGRSAGHRARAASQPRHDAQHPAEFVLRVRLQRALRCRSPPACSIRRSGCCSIR